MEMKAISYIFGIVTAMFVIVPTAKMDVLQTAAKVVDNVAMDAPPVIYEVEKKKREVALLRSEVAIKIAEIEIVDTLNAE